MALALAAPALLAGCGGSEPDLTEVAIGTGTLPELDPALASDPQSLEALWLIHTPLLTYRHADAPAEPELIPGLAADLPEVSADGHTYTLELREGLEYSDGTPVRASDFERAIERVEGLAPPIAALYEPIAEIETDDDSGEIEIRLGEPDAEFANLLALVSSAPVPGETPLALTQPPPGVGPYEVAAADSESVVLRRSETFADLGIPQIPTGEIDEITIKAGGTPATRAQAVLDGKLDYMQDSPPRELRSTIAEQAGERFAEHPASSTLLFTLDDDAPPFDDPLVREAVNRALDKPRLVRAAQGQLAAGCSLLAPASAAYDEALDRLDCPYGDPRRRPRIRLARDLIAQADARGARVAIAAGEGAHAESLAGAYARILDRIGLDAEVGATVEGAQAVLTATPVAFPSPAGAFAILRASGGVDDPLIGAEATRLGATAPADATAGWRELDRYLVSPPQSYVAAFGHPRATTFLSERIDPGLARFNPVYGSDYSSWKLKEGE